MSGHAETLVDAGEDHQSIMNDCVSIDGFTPSLPSLLNRPPDTDASSVSDVESISNGETVSDTADDFDEITYSEIPALASTISRQDDVDECSETDMEQIMMSDRTIIPDVAPLAQRMPQISLQGDGKSVSMPDYGYIEGLLLADEPFRSQKGPLRLAFVGDAQTSNLSMALIVAKLVTTATGNPFDKEKVLDAATRTVPGFLHSLSIPVEVTHIVGYDANQRRLLLNGGGGRDVEASEFDFAVIYHKELGHVSHVHTLAMELSYSRVPMLELSGKEGSGACVIESTLQRGNFLRVRPHPDHVSDSGDTKDTPISLKAFVYDLEDETLSRHLSYISNHVKSYPDRHSDNKATLTNLKVFKSFSLLQHPWFDRIVHGFSYLGMVFLAAGFCSLLVQRLSQDPLAGAANRTTALQLALNNSGMANINASSILRYPVTTTVNGLSTTSVAVYPSQIQVQVLKPDQLLVSLPTSYKKNFHVGVFKNGKALYNVNATRLINGVCVLALPSTAAHGQVQVSVFLHEKPNINETVKVDLGNRLLQRVTYETAAKGIQHEVSEVHSAAKLVRAKLRSDFQSALNQSVYGVRCLGLGVVDSIRVSTEAAGAASNHTVQTFRYVSQLTYNTSSVAGSFLKSAVPQRRHFVRAHTNALKIRARLLRKSSVARQANPVKRTNAISRALSGIKSQISIVPAYANGIAEFVADFAPVKMINKGSRKTSSASTKSKTIVTSTTMVAKKTRKMIGLEGKKQCAASAKHARRSGKVIDNK